MTYAAGALSQVAVTATTASLESAAATGGSGPYTYQWYRSTTSGFTPGGGNILSGETALTLEDTGLIPGTQYYYKVVATDTGNSNVTAESAQLAVATAAETPSQNQFAQSTVVGQVDQAFNGDTLSVEVDATQTTDLVAGQAVKVYDRAGGVPKVVACSANSDECVGFVNYDFVHASYPAGRALQVSASGNCMYLRATGAIGRGVQVSLDVTTKGGVRAAAGHTGDKIVGWAYDKAAAAGDVIRVMLKTPSFTVV